MTVPVITASLEKQAPGLFFRPPGFSPYIEGEKKGEIRDWTTIVIEEGASLVTVSLQHIIMICVTEHRAK